MILIRIHFNSIRVSLKNRDSLRNKQTNKQNKKLYTTTKEREFTSFVAVAIIVAQPFYFVSTKPVIL